MYGPLNVSIAALKSDRNTEKDECSWLNPTVVWTCSHSSVSPHCIRSSPMKCCQGMCWFCLCLNNDITSKRSARVDVSLHKGQAPPPRDGMRHNVTVMQWRSVARTIAGNAPDASQPTILAIQQPHSSINNSTVDANRIQQWFKWLH